MHLVCIQKRPEPKLHQHTRAAPVLCWDLSAVLLTRPRCIHWSCHDTYQLSYCCEGADHFGCCMQDLLHQIAIICDSMHLHMRMLLKVASIIALATGLYQASLLCANGVAAHQCYFSTI